MASTIRYTETLRLGFNIRLRHANQNDALSCAGQCLRRIPKAHSSAVSCIEFTKEGSQLLSGALDGSLVLHGLKSGRALREYKGHTSYINAAIFSKDGSRVNYAF